ncbi:MAG: DUF2520 domain-containing protein [Bacteroidales bacterium]|nr:DUF2520 domain-containing protein [Bacteroidales bacterium]
MGNNQIVIIGAGNVATNIAKVLKEKVGAEIHIHSKTENSAKLLADKLQASYSSDFNNITPNANLYIISISDNAISEIVQNKTLKEKINNNFVVHTAGSISMDVLKNLSANYGIFYPLQTFSKFKQANFKNIPLCLEANSGFNYNRLSKYAFQISEDVRKINSEQRKYIHLAAVFANNFSNRMFAIAEEILKDKQINFDIMLPLINETVAKIQKNSPSKSQTGPAIRNDKEVTDMHIKLLSENKNLQEIYNLISKNINNNG